MSFAKIKVVLIIILSKLSLDNDSREISSQKLKYPVKNYNLFCHFVSKLTFSIIRKKISNTRKIPKEQKSNNKNTFS